MLSSLTVIDIDTKKKLEDINLAEDYNPLSGEHKGPIQTPVSPDGKYVVTVNFLSSTMARSRPTRAWAGKASCPYLSPTLACSPPPSSSQEQASSLPRSRAGSSSQPRSNAVPTEPYCQPVSEPRMGLFFLNQ